MKKQRVLALLLCLALLCTLIPGVFAANDNGMEISKTATANDDGTYTVTLEAYATGSKIISEVKKDIPTDIVLVLDQSGSMANKFSTVTVDSYPESSGTNATFYANQSDLYYQLDDGGYVKVTVTREEAGVTEQYNQVPYYYKYNSQLKEYADNNNLYYKVSEGNYKPVTVEQSGSWGQSTYTYKYTDENGSHTLETVNAMRWPQYTYYTKETVTNYKYTYSYVIDGETIIIEVSEGSTNAPTETFYRKTTTTQNLTRLDALKNAVTTFADNVAQKAAGADGILGTEDDVNHRIAIAGFSSNGYDNTELLTGVEITTGDYRGTKPNTDSNYYFPTGYEKNGASYDSGITVEQYKKALQNMNDSIGQQNVNDGIAAITAEGGTMINQGLDMANQIFKNNSVIEGKRNRVIVVFTDGAPGEYGNWQQASRNTANSALSNAYISKNTYNATVYTVGVFSGADASNPSSLPDYTTDSPNTSEQTKNSNRFMHLLSSNYPEATKMNSTGSINPNLAGKSYYLSAGDADTLNNIFQQISDQIESGGSSTTLGSETVIKDIISPSFTLPEGTTADNITLETYECTGKDGDEYTWSNNNSTMGATATVSGDQVSVTGFDFADHYVGTVTEGGDATYRGDKLVISFKVTPKAGFLGGNNVFTNTSAGVYENSSAAEPVLTFERPQVNVPIKDVTVTAADKNVYLLGSVTGAQLKAGATVKVGGVALDLSAANYGLADWQTAYVDITVEIKDKYGNAVTGDLSGLTDDTTYSISVTVAPKETANATSRGTEAVTQTGENEPDAKINVFKPKVTFKDGEAWYGDDVPAEVNSNLTETKWLHGTDEADTAAMGEAPALALTYTPNPSKIANGKINTKQDIAVDVTVKISGTDVTQKTTFAHTSCDASVKCSWNETTPDGSPAFLLHVKTCQLTVTKTGGAANEPYVFTVKKDGTKYTEVTVVGNGSETIYELPVGTYTIAEDTGWSWRYSANNGGSASLTANNPSDSITCANTMKEPYWLNGFSEVAKNISGISK